MNPWKQRLKDAETAFYNENPWHSGHRVCPHALREYPWLTFDLSHFPLPDPQLSIDAHNCDAYSTSAPYDHGIVIAWNAHPIIKGWERDITPIDPDQPSAVIWLSCAENSACLARLLPHPKWRIRLTPHCRPNYHTL